MVDLIFNSDFSGMHFLCTRDYQVQNILMNELLQNNNTTV